MTMPTYITTESYTLPSGRTVEISSTLPHQTVDCSEYSSALATIDRIVSHCVYRGESCTRPEACAAAFSVPDGAPIEMAADNVGCELSDAAAQFMHAGAQGRRVTRRILGY